MSLKQGEVEVYDRQLRLWGFDAQKALKLSKVCIVGSKVVCTELARHLNLSGINLTFVSETEELVEPHSLQEDFLFREEHVGKNKLEVLKAELSEMNPHNQVAVEQVSSLAQLTAEFFTSRNFSLVVCAFAWPKQVAFLNAEARKAKIAFYFLKSCGPYGFVYCDLGQDEFSYKWQAPKGLFGKKKEGLEGKEVEFSEDHTEERQVKGSKPFEAFIRHEASSQSNLKKRQVNNKNLWLYLLFLSQCV